MVSIYVNRFGFVKTMKGMLFVGAFALGSFRVNSPGVCTIFKLIMVAVEVEGNGHFSQV